VINWIDNPDNINEVFNLYGFLNNHLNEDGLVLPEARGFATELILLAHFDLDLR
jgi:hypothetical protein